MTQSIGNRAWGTKLCQGDASRTQNATDAVSWGDPTRTGTAFDFRSELFLHHIQPLTITIQMSNNLNGCDPLTD